MFLTNNSPDLYALTLCIIFRMSTLFLAASRNINEFEWKSHTR